METTCRAWLAGVLTMLLLAVAGAVSAQTTIYPSDPLTSGQAVSGSVGLNSWKNYKITASSSHTQLQVDLTNLSADVDLYVRKDYSPTTTAYTCRPYKGGTTAENCTISISGGATWYIGVQGYQAGSFTIKATLSGGTTIYPADPLTSGQTVSGSVGLNSWKNYKITSSSSDTQLKVDMTGLSADVDLYVRKDASPTSQAFTCRPYSGGTTSESCTLPNSGAATWYISVYGYQAGSFNIKATLSGSTPPPSSITTLTSGQAVSGSAAYNEWKKYKITSSSTDTQIKVDMTNLSADVDLYVQKGAEPTSSSYLCRPYSGGTTSESCTLPNSGSATWYISVYGYQAGSFNIKATLSGSTPPPSTITTLTSGQAVSGSAGYNEWKKYKITSSSTDTQLQVDMTGLSADVDLYVQKGAEPTSSSYLCRPYSGGTTSESCTLTNSGAATWYISVYGFAAGSYNLKATLSAGTSAGAFVFPFQERNNVWQICQGYNSNPTHTGTLIHSFDFAYGTGNLGTTACWGNPSGSENQIVVAPAAGMIAWIGNNYPDITCLTLQNTISNGHGSNIASVKLGHMKSGATRVVSGSVSRGTPIGILCGPNGCAGDGGYAHVHISAYTSTDCGNAQGDTSVPLGTVFGGSYDFSSNGTVRQWFTTEIPAQ